MARAERLPRFPLGASAEGRGILEDFPSSLGVLLASAIRDLGMRVDQGAPVPGGAAARVAAIRGHLGEQEVVAPLIVIARSVAGELPWDLSEVTRACRHIAAWAARAGARRTHLEFVRVSARLYPGDLEVVLEAARLSRDSGFGVGGALVPARDQTGAGIRAVEKLCVGIHRHGCAVPPSGQYTGGGGCSASRDESRTSASSRLGGGFGSSPPIQYHRRGRTPQRSLLSR